MIGDLLPVLPAFCAATVLLAMAPGPATALLTRDAARGSARDIGRTIAGIEVGILGWALASGLGIAALVAASEVAYDVLRIVGAVVLLVLGIQTLWHARRNARADDDAEAPRSLLRITGFRGGLATNLANPKAAVFAFAFYPQFIPDGVPVLAATLVFGVVHVLIDTVWYSTLAFAVTRVRRWLGSPAVRRRIEQVTGAVLVGLGVRLAFEQR